MTEEHICQKYKESPAEKTAFRKAANDIFVRALRMLLCAALLLSVSACGRKNPNGEDSRKEVGERIQLKEPKEWKQSPDRNQTVSEEYWGLKLPRPIMR